MKTRPYITERLLMGRKESNQTNIAACILPLSTFVRVRAGPSLVVFRCTIIW